MNKQQPHNNHEMNFTDIDFLYRKCSVPTYSMAYWISVPEFYDRIKQISGTNTTIDNALVFDVMLEIYKEKLEDKEYGWKVNFNFHTSRKALRSLSFVLFGDKEAWQNM